MLVKKLIAAFTLAGMATAYPAEDFEVTSDLEERTSCPMGHSWCCKQAAGPIFGTEGLGQGCYSSNGGGCNKGTSSLCCMHGQYIKREDGFQVLCTRT
ncbi:hypothetical protein N7490_012277 [Penicillium lividum]|nr:hypothetical protein N7490_012277 [Penicillium lividum]